MAIFQDNLPKGRVLSVDALRGFDMFWIIGGSSLVASLMTRANTPFTLAIAQQFQHSEWHGFTFEDLIFPLFLFIVGVSLSFSLTKRLERGDSRKDLYIQILKRTLILYFLGMIINAKLIGYLGGLRYTGVLPRIAFCYFFASLIVMNFDFRRQAIWAVALLIGYWLAMTLIPVPGYGAGVFTPEGSLASWLDRMYLPGQLRTKLYDNEGIMSTFPAVATTLFGVLSGGWLRREISPNRKVLGLVGAGAAGLALGLAWNIIFPINKLLWTSSFALFAGGISILLLALFYWLIDVRGYRKWAFPFVVVGLNSITIYFAQGIFDFGLIVTVFVHEFAGHLGSYRSLFLTVCVITVKWLFLYILYRKKIFLRA